MATTSTSSESMTYSSPIPISVTNSSSEPFQQTLLSSILTMSENLTELMKELDTSNENNVFALNTAAQNMTNIQQYLFYKQQLSHQQREYQNIQPDAALSAFASDSGSPIQLPIHAFQPINEQLVQSPELIPCEKDYQFQNISYGTNGTAVPAIAASSSDYSPIRDSRRNALCCNDEDDHDNDCHHESYDDDEENYNDDDEEEEENDDDNDTTTNFYNDSTINEINCTIMKQEIITPHSTSSSVFTSSVPPSPVDTYKRQNMTKASRANSSSSTHSNTSTVHISSSSTSNKCPVCEKHISRDLSRHLRTHNEIPRFQCVFPHNYCRHRTGKFHRPYDFKKHLLNYHFKYDDPLAKKYQNLTDKLKYVGTCSCGLKFGAKEWLEEHILTKDASKRCSYVVKSID